MLDTEPEFREIASRRPGGMEFLGSHPAERRLAAVGRFIVAAHETYAGSESRLLSLGEDFPRSRAYQADCQPGVLERDAGNLYVLNVAPPTLAA
jgi:hypothetical protein